LTEFLYSGEQFDSKIGQQYLRQRYYDSATGRFNRLDPFFGNLNCPQSLHKYLYTHADPVNRIDPSGKWTVIGCISAIGTGIRNHTTGAIASFTARRYALGVSAGTTIGFTIGAVDAALADDATFSDILMGGLMGAAAGLTIGLVAPFIHPGILLSVGLPVSSYGVYDAYVQGTICKLFSD
ncbi:MAG: RHS repeat-associated core domain-containing protein, partial [Bacteroidales bacterium]|nr:RHS repeat-associated core domain-containing protein [Bacteroidales bacterium]